MRTPRLLLLAPLLLLAGCGGDTRQPVADSAATIVEAADAIALGAPPAGPLAVIRANALAIIAAQGFTYVPSSATAAPAVITPPAAAPAAASK